MRRLDKLFAALLLLIAILAFPGTAKQAMAAEVGIEVVVTRSDDVVTVALVTTEDLTFGGVEGHFDFDDTAFSFKSSQGGVLDTAVNVKNRMFGSNTGEHMSTEKGTELVIFTYRITSGFSEDQSYEFSFDLDDAYNAGLTYYDWADWENENLHLAAVLKGTGSESVPPVVEPADPTEPTEPTDPTEPVTPTEPTDPTEPTEPTEPTDPTEPTNPVPPTDPVEPVDPTDPVTPGTPSEPVEPSDPATPTTPDSPTTPASPGTTQPSTEPEPTPHVITYKDEDGNVVFEITVEDGETIAAIDLPEEDEKWAFHGIEFDFSLPVDRDITLVATKTDDLLEAASLTVEMPTTENGTEGEFAFILRFDGFDDTVEFRLKNGDRKNFQMPVGTAYELTVRGAEGTEYTAQVDADGKQQPDVKGAAGKDLVVSSTMGAGENRVRVTGVSVAANQKTQNGLWLAVPVALAVIAAVLFIVIKRKRNKK